MIKHPFARVLATFLLLVAQSALAQTGFYRLESSVVLPSPQAPSWDYLAFDPSRSYLFIARRADGVTVYDTVAKRVVRTLENSKGGNATVLMPEFDRIFVINQDGTTTVYEFKTLKALDRLKLGESADNGFYEPVTQQIMVTMGDDSQVAFMNAKTGAVNGTLRIDSKMIEGSAADGKGNLYVALRDRDKLVRVDARTKALSGEWKLDGCVLPNGVAYDAVTERVFLTCRGEHPILAVLDPATGRGVAKTAIGRGNDVVIFDPSARRIYTANGFDGTLVIIKQLGADSYALDQALTTRPYARTMALDPKTKKVYLVSAEGTVDPSKPWRTEVAPFYPNRYFPGTFTLLTYALEKSAASQ